MPLDSREDMSISDNHPKLSTIQSTASTALTGGKRKRENALSAAKGDQNGSDQGGTRLEQLHQLFKDTVDILKSHDITSPSILDYPIPSIPSESPVAKKARLATSPKNASIASLVGSKGYNSISALFRDLEAVTASVLAGLENKTPGGEDGDRAKIRNEAHPEAIRATALKQEFNAIIVRELLQRPHLLDRSKSNDQKSTPEDGIPGKSSFTSDHSVDRDENNYATVLTLFGGSNQPKQLFSSLKAQSNTSSFETEKLKSTVSEVGLPNGISFTKIVPVQSKEKGDNIKNVPVLKELFAPPSSIPSLNPPRQSRHTATRSSSVNWYNPTEATTPNRTSRRDSFSTQPLSTGQWLSYNVAPSTKDLSSPDSKRKQRDRALSFGEPQNEPSERTRALHRQAKEDALFRSAYSTFSPDRDNAAAILSERSKNRLWWKRIGEQRYLNSISWPSHEPNDDEIDGLSNPDLETGDSVQEISLEDAVESWVPEENPLEAAEEQQRPRTEDIASKDVDEILNGISELLETLNSYQDVRNSSLTTNARTPASQNPQLAAMTGTPMSPSADEGEIYNMLKSQLSIMVSSLPPYALTKLDGEKLSVLNVNTKIQVETPNFPGSLEEDEISTKGRLPAASVAASYPTRTPSATVGLAPRNNYLATSTPAATSHRPGHVPQTVPTRPTAAASYLTNQQYPTRPPPASQYFANNARPSYPTQRPMPSSTPDRYSYSATQQYGQQPARQSYVNGYNQYPQQNGTAYGQGYAHSQQPSAATRMPQASYPQSARPSQSYSYAPTPKPSGGSASPSKAAMQYAAHGYANQNTPSHPPSHPRPPAYQQQASQYTSQNPTSPQVNGISSSQRPQANNDQAVHANQQEASVGDAGRGNSNTPQPVNAGQTTPGQVNGASMGQQNGLTAVQTG
ncbi:MAG: hypothetical protein Q9184_002695 [Pyrenodesmia sp. 2 TL-2023]